MRGWLTILIAAVLVFQPVNASRAQAAQSAASPQEAESENATLKEQALKLPPQSFVEVRLRSKEKVRGWLAGVSDAGVALQIARGDKLETREVGFSDVKSIKVQSTKGSKALKVGLNVVLWTFAGFGFIVLACAFSSCLAD